MKRIILVLLIALILLAGCRPPQDAPAPALPDVNAEQTGDANSETPIEEECSLPSGRANLTEEQMRGVIDALIDIIYQYEAGTVGQPRTAFMPMPQGLRFPRITHVEPGAFTGVADFVIYDGHDAGSYLVETMCAAGCQCGDCTTFIFFWMREIEGEPNTFEVYGAAFIPEWRLRAGFV